MKTKKYIIITLLITFLSFFSGCDSEKQETIQEEKTPVNITTNKIVENRENESETLTPEEVLKRMDEAEGIGIEQGPVSVEIVSPEEEVFKQSQARHYNAMIDGIVNGSTCKCNWKFYLNEYSEETLYKEQGTICTKSIDQEKTNCGFTSTFIDSRGKLRVVVDVEVKKGGEFVGTYSDEKNYIVE